MNADQQVLATFKSSILGVHDEAADDEGGPADRSHTCPDQAHNSGALKLAAKITRRKDNQRDRRCRSARLKRTVPKGLFQYRSNPLCSWCQVVRRSRRLFARARRLRSDSGQCHGLKRKKVVRGGFPAWLRRVIFPGWRRVVRVSCGMGEAPARRGIA